MKKPLRMINGLCCLAISARLYAAEFQNASGGDAGAGRDLDAQIEQAMQVVREAEQRVREAMRETEYTDPECSKIKRELVELEKKVLELRQQLYMAVRASESVRKAEAERRAAVHRLQELRLEGRQSEAKDSQGDSP